MRKHVPADALALLRSRYTIEFACDVVRNIAFAKASATTRDAFGMRVLDGVSSRDVRRAMSDQLAALFVMPMALFEARMMEEPVRRSEIPKPNGGSRQIGIPTFLRRCISNALNEVLVLTSDSLLPHCVRAYRRGRSDAVQEAVLDVAEAVSDGRVRHFVKVDIQSFFSEITWPAIENSLLENGYDPDFIARVMAVVKCPVVRNERGHLVTETTTKGAQMGLAESSVLANLVLLELDRELGAQHPRVFYARYSDDLFVGAAQKHEVVAVVRHIASWCRRHGMRLKGVERNARLSSLVRHVKKTKIEFLGAEVDHLAYVHMPESKLRAKLSELARMQERVALDEVRGVSRYGGGGGTEAFDDEDVHRTVQAFLDYWSALDPRGAARARLIMERRFPSTSATSDVERGTVWFARLWRDQTDRAGGHGHAIHDPTERSESGPPRPTRKSPPATGERAGAAPVENRGLSPRPHASSAAYPSDPRPIPCHSGIAGGSDIDPSTGEVSPDPFNNGLDDSYPYADEEEASRSSTERRESYRFDTLSSADTFGCTDLETNFNRLDLPGPAAVGRSRRATSDPTEGASPPRSVFENSRLRFVHATSVKVGRDRVVVVGRCDVVDGEGSRVDVQVVQNCRPEAALVRQLTSEVRASRGDSIALGMSDTWLAKALLQPTRRFRAPLLFGHVLDLHEAARGREVVLVAGLEVPATLASAIDARADRVVRDFTLRECGVARPAHEPISSRAP